MIGNFEKLGMILVVAGLVVSVQTMEKVGIIEILEPEKTVTVFGGDVVDVPGCKNLIEQTCKNPRTSNKFCTDVLHKKTQCEEKKVGEVPVWVPKPTEENPKAGEWVIEEIYDYRCPKEGEWSIIGKPREKWYSESPTKTVAGFHELETKNWICWEVIRCSAYCEKRNLVSIGPRWICEVDPQSWEEESQPGYTASDHPDNFCHSIKTPEPIF